ncbi:MAG: hypothetical protein NVS2B14_00380 [Chamaesiphon sp.]
MTLDLSATKVPVFNGINDAPHAPTAQAAGNAAHVIAQHNELADAVQQALNAPPPQHLPLPDHTVNNSKITELYVDSTTGNDSTADGTAAHPYKTFAALLAFAKSKSIVNSLYIYPNGTFNEPIDLRGFQGHPDPTNSPGNIGNWGANCEVQLMTAGSNPNYTLNLGKNLFFPPGIDENVDCTINNANIISNDYIALRGRNVNFTYCNFSNTANNGIFLLNGCVVTFSNCTVTGTGTTLRSFVQGYNSKVEFYGGSGTAIANVVQKAFDLISSKLKIAGAITVANTPKVVGAAEFSSANIDSQAAATVIAGLITKDVTSTVFLNGVAQ